MIRAPMRTAVISSLIGARRFLYITNVAGRKGRGETCLATMKSKPNQTRLFLFSLDLETQARGFSLTRAHYQHQCVHDYEGTLKQFNNTFHTHAENNINSLKKISTSKILQKDANAPPFDLLKYPQHEGTNKMKESPHPVKAQYVQNCLLPAGQASHLKIKNIRLQNAASFLFSTSHECVSCSATCKSRCGHMQK